MASTTPNLELRKIDLTDAPPDITVLNENWDKLDEEIGDLVANSKIITYTTIEELGLTPGSETINSIVLAMADSSILQTGVGAGYNTAQYPGGGHGTLLVFKKANGRTLLLFSFTNTEESELYYGSYYNSSGVEKWSGWRSYLPTTGGTLTGNLDLKKVNNGHGGLYKNHTTSADYGTTLYDEDASGNSAKLAVCAATNDVSFVDNEGSRHTLYGEHNPEMLRTNASLNMKMYTDLTQIGLTAGSETIATIASKLPTYSRLVLTVGSTNNASIYPDGNYGLLTVEKTVNTRIVFTFTNNAGTQWMGTYSIASSGDTWSDWYMMYSSKNLRNGTSSVTAGSTALATGHVYLQYK